MKYGARYALVSLCLLSGAGLLIAGGQSQQPLATTPNDFFTPGTQPGFATPGNYACTNEGGPCNDFNVCTENDTCTGGVCLGEEIKGCFVEPLLSAQSGCVLCHSNYAPDHSPMETWQTSLMAQAARDPVWHAAVSIAEQDAPSSGETCLRCHAPKAWLEGRSTPTDGSALVGEDFEGVTCIACHRMIDPVYEAGVNPPEDLDQLNALPFPPASTGNGSYVIDLLDRRRGPFDLAIDYPDFNFHFWLESPFHRESAQCGTCHEVSNQAYERQGGPVPAPSDTYILGTLDAAHPTLDRYDMFPEQRTYSEWLESDFADGPIDMGGRFGGNNPLVSSCQDCHMPDTTGTACNPAIAQVVRDDLPLHRFAGAANWVLDSIIQLDLAADTPDGLYGAAEVSGLSQMQIDDAKASNVAFLQSAADLEATFESLDLNVRVTNQTGHKLPTGYPEGRRIWVNVQYKDNGGTIIDERGAYDDELAELDAGTTKVYHSEVGMDEVTAAATNLPAGQSFHLVLNNEWIFDNRIPPRGFTNAGFAAVQAAPVDYSYADGQHWDDTLYDIPCDARTAEVRLYYQSTSKEYAEFLRDTNVTNSKGDIFYGLYEDLGMSAPIEMNSVIVDLPDCNFNGMWDACDIDNGDSDDVDMDGIPDECVCSSFTDCADMDENGIRDDNCIWWACEDNLCVGTGIRFADMAGQFGSCPPDGAADGNDRFAALNCFSNSDPNNPPPAGFPCEPDSPNATNVDAGGAFGSCVPDGVCDGNDAFAALNAFSGTTSCSCPLDGGPSPVIEPFVTEGVAIRLDSNDSVAPGSLIEVRVLIDGPVDDLRGYQLHLGVDGGDSGQLVLEDITIERHRDHAFAGTAFWRAFNVERAQMVVGLDTPGVATRSKSTYLATYVYRASRDARGTFYVDLLHDDDAGTHRTFLFPTPAHGKVAIDASTSAEITVSSSTKLKARARR